MDAGPKLYFDPQVGLDAAKIRPGEYYASARDMVIVTVLGSCVSACLWDETRKVGGMNHFMLPDAGANGVDMFGESGRYGAFAMELLINELIKMGAQKSRLKAKVFGAGNVMQSLSSSNVGERNAEFVERFLGNEGIPILARDLLDVWPRKVYLFPTTGRVLVRKLKTLNNDTIITRERAYTSQLRTSKSDQTAGDIELFV
ncbi:MAG: chemoreceptor glutamine deamidase CheD [Burkholderiales bacterium]|nr:chemoreceptor glutamine deamidase CheD [Burkholderiales bacterium]